MAVPLGYYESLFMGKMLLKDTGTVGLEQQLSQF